MYFSTRKTAEPDKILNTWIGPFTIRKTLKNVLAEIEPVLFSARIIVGHIT